LKAIPAINTALVAQGLDVAEIPSQTASNTLQKSSSSNRKPRKANIEATSDEEENEED
jgi:hypothetical protein